MIKIIAGGKRHLPWADSAIKEYEKRLRKPYDLSWEFMDEDKLASKLAQWPFKRQNDYVICCDERGQNISSSEYSAKLESALTQGKNVIILIGGAYGFTEEVRTKADFIWGFSRLVFPHMLARVIVAEQTYRASEIQKGSKYHHE